MPVKVKGSAQVDACCANRGVIFLDRIAHAERNST
jgi:hypothetical protein